MINEVLIWILLLILHKKITSGCLLELPCQGNSNEYRYPKNNEEFLLNTFLLWSCEFSHNEYLTTLGIGTDKLMQTV